MRTRSRIHRIDRRRVTIPGAGNGSGDTPTKCRACERPSNPGFSTIGARARGAFAPGGRPAQERPVWPCPPLRPNAPGGGGVPVSPLWPPRPRRTRLLKRREKPRGGRRCASLGYVRRRLSPWWEQPHHIHTHGIDDSKGMDTSPGFGKRLARAVTAHTGEVGDLHLTGTDKVDSEPTMPMTRREA